MRDRGEFNSWCRETARAYSRGRHLEGVDQRVMELDTTVRQRTKEDRPYHRHTALALDKEAVYARIAWTGSKERSATIEAHVRTLEAQVATLIAQTTSLQT
ncbi:hypothetical protein Tco_0416734 [Tanacetum coccineum]